MTALMYALKYSKIYTEKLLNEYDLLLLNLI
jgi:hypothetical protein